jgi:MFS family permease
VLPFFGGIRHFFGSRGFFVGFFLVVNLYSWFFPLYIFYEGALRNLIADYGIFEFIIGVHYLSALVFAFVGVLLVEKTRDRSKVLVLWMLMGVGSSLLLVFLPTVSNLPYLCFSSFLLGASLGLGFPSFLAYFADHNDVNRGKRAGVAFFVSGIGIVIVGLATVLLPLVASVAVFAIWRAIACLVFLLQRPREKLEFRAKVTYRSILGERAFLLYFVPWIMYCVINYSEASLLRGFFGPVFSYYVPVAEFGIGGVVALFGGYLSDLIGRKVVIVSGYAALGIGYAILGLFPYNTVSWYFYVVVDSVSIGVFSMAFFILVWGELAVDRLKEKYFLLGGIPYLILSFLGIALEPYVKDVPVSSAFSLAAFFLFIAILPLMYAPETLPEKNIKERELKGYVEKAKKTKEKYT